MPNGVSKQSEVIGAIDGNQIAILVHEWVNNRNHSVSDCYENRNFEIVPTFLDSIMLQEFLPYFFRRWVSPKSLHDEYLLFIQNRGSQPFFARGPLSANFTCVAPLPPAVSYNTKNVT